MKIQEFPLAWRWTDSRYAVLPGEVLSCLRPLSAEETRRLIARTQKYQNFPGDLHSSEITNIEGRDWLRQQNGRLLDIVSIVWGPGCALSTSWEIFIEYWDDFCYPASDDVTIWPDSEDWILFFSHEEQFRFIRLSSS
jgi:hypothetical protein